MASNHKGMSGELPRMLTSRHLALVSVLAAVYALGSFLPGFPMIGVPGSSIDLVRALEPAYGLILGPILGSLTAFIGALVGKIMTGGSAVPFTPLALLSAFVAASLGRRSVFRIKGWLISATILALLIAVWYITPAGSVFLYYPFMHIVALAVILLFRGQIADYAQSKNKGKLSLGVLLCSFPAIMAGHMLGNLIFYYLYNPSPFFFIGILPVTVFERTTLTVLSTLIATPVIVIVRSVFPEIVKELA